MMSVLRARKPAWLRGHGQIERVRFRDAIPLRRDRRDLRRRFRRAARAAMAERKAQAAAQLGQLAANRVPLYAVTRGGRDTERVVEFSDGTRLFLFSTRAGAASLGRLAPGPAWSPVWLAQVRPCFAPSWFRLWFASASQPRPLEVLAAVAPTVEAFPC